MGTNADNLEQKFPKDERTRVMLCTTASVHLQIQDICKLQVPSTENLHEVSSKVYGNAKAREDDLPMLGCKAARVCFGFIAARQLSLDTIVCDGRALDFPHLAS